MIVLDTSAIICILFDKRESETCLDALERADEISISAATLAEALIVAGRRGFGPQLRRLIYVLDPNVAIVDDAVAVRVASVYERWGKGIHSAKLNYGDCFSYELAERHGCALLYIGNDFAQTDIAVAI